MTLPKHYHPSKIEPELTEKWGKAGTYHFQLDSPAPVYSIDTPPATVSGSLHLGHAYSYSHPDFIARFWRMNGYNVFYPMGFDDNGLPTGRLVETQFGLRAKQMGRNKFTEKCIQVSQQYAEEYQLLWQKLGLSIDWRYTYRTISATAQKVSQFSFIELFKQGLAYRKESPTIWCPECETAIAQAELEDTKLDSEYLFLNFPVVKIGIDSESTQDCIQIATTRPELLPACVAVFVHPQDKRYLNVVGSTAIVPIFNQRVPILTDPLVDPLKGTGAVMCCTFGDQTDVAWWHLHRLPLIEAIDRHGNMTSSANQFQGLSIHEARLAIKNVLVRENFLSAVLPITHTVSVHERCLIPIEYITSTQWFIRVLDFQGKLLQAGREVNWFPPHMGSSYKSWVENLNWDWCISRQRFYGVPFPIWYCQACGEIIPASLEQLPVDPTHVNPPNPCPNCGGESFSPETDVMDTWATSSLTPQIAGGWLIDPDRYKKVTPFSLRPQAHEIIRTWTFYTLIKSLFHFNALPWENILVSGWGIAGEGMGKISKSRGGGLVSAMGMIQSYSADAVRYWAASTGPGKDSIISEEKIKNGARLVNKLWNVARFSAIFIRGFIPHDTPARLTTADRWALSKTQKLINQVTTFYRTYDYAAAKAETETFFWVFADNYLEMIKQRLYHGSSDQIGAIFTLHHILLTIIKLFAPILPFVTERIYQGLFTSEPYDETSPLRESIHTSSWLEPRQYLIDEQSEAAGELIIEIATQVRRYKSERSLPLNTTINRLQLGLPHPTLCELLEESIPDLLSITRAENIEICQINEMSLPPVHNSTDIHVAIEP